MAAFPLPGAALWRLFQWPWQAADEPELEETDPVKIIVGLGNPGPRYQYSRHNMGFLALDAVAAATGIRLDKEKHRGLLGQGRHAGLALLLVKPMTYMNRSGDCVAPVVRNKIQSPADILVLVDDVNLPLGRIRMRAGGSAGGHNGLKSLIERLGTRDFARLRMGVGDKRRGGDLAEHVLAKFMPEERSEVEQVVQRSAEAALRWVESGAEKAMSEFNN